MRAVLAVDAGGKHIITLVLLEMKHLRAKSELTEIPRHPCLGLKLAALHAFEIIAVVAVDEKHLRAAVATAVVDIRADEKRAQGLGISVNIYCHGNSFHQCALTCVYLL